MQARSKRRPAVMVSLPALCALLALTLAAPSAASSSPAAPGAEAAKKKKKCKKKKKKRSASVTKRCKKKLPATPPAGSDAPAPPPPQISVSDATTTYPALAAHPIEFQVSLSAPSAVPVGVSFSTGAPGDTAMASEDYSASADTLVIPAGSTTAPVPIDVLPSASNPSNGAGAEPAEMFTLTLSSPSNATLADGLATGTITTDDESPCPDEFFPGPPDLETTTLRFGSLCVGDTMDTFSLEADSNELWRITLVPMNADDDPDFQFSGGPVTPVGGSGSQGPGQTEYVDYSSLISFSVSIDVIHGDDHMPARAEGYLIFASQLS